MAQQHPALDLASLSEQLPEKYAVLKRRINQLRSAHSIKTDLDIAFDMLEALDVAIDQAERLNVPGEARSWQSSAAIAILNSAIILYARATKTSSKHRYSIDFNKHFTPEQKSVHKRLCDLRDESIAHFGPGLLENGELWQLEGVFVPLDDPENMKVMTGSRRLIKQLEIQHLMKAQIHRALMIANRITLERNAYVVEELNKVFDESDFVEIAQKNRVDLVDFFKSTNDAKRVLRNRVGRATGVVGH